MKQIDLNCDMGESFGAYTLGKDASAIGYISSANIACGFHAGDPLVLDRTVKLAADNKVGIGAHPGHPDLVGFGRRPMDCTPAELRADIIYQIGAIRAFCNVHGVRLQHVKPHGALYNSIVGNEDTAKNVAEAIASVDPQLFWVTLAGFQTDMIRRICQETGIRPIFEAFPDRAYTADGHLLSRRLPGAVIHNPEEVAERAVRMVTEQRVIAIDGTNVPLDAQTLCVHGDTPSAVDLLQKIRAAMASADIAVVPMGEMFPARQISPHAKIRLNGDRGLLCEYGNTIDPETNRIVRSMTRLLMQYPLKGIQSVVPAYRSLCLNYNPSATTLDAIKKHLTRLENRLTDICLPQPEVVAIPVCYGGDMGPDLTFVADHAGLSEADVVRLHSRVEYPIYMIGFTPGFCYLGGLDKRLSTPRLKTPRTMIDAGSVGIANSQTGIYPSASPGGWQIIGRTPLRLFDPDRENPFLYQPGDKIRFVPISEDEYQKIAAKENNR